MPGVEQKKKQNWFMRHKVLTVIGVIFLIGMVGTALSGGGTQSDNKQAASAESSTQPVTPKYVYNIPDLLGKNIDEVRTALGNPKDGKFTEPTAAQKAISSQWDNTFEKDSQELVITFDASTREVIDYFLSGDDKSKLLEAGNLKENSSNYSIEPVVSLKDSSAITGIIIRQN